LSEVERAGLIPDEVERADADEAIPALTRLCIKHALRASASSSSVDADADAAVVAPVDTQPIIVLEEEELDDIVLDFLDHLGDLDLSAFSVSGLIQ
jgi:hypothetical protein